MGGLWSLSLPPDTVDELGAAELGSELDREEDRAATNGFFFFLVLLMTPALHLDFLGCLERFFLQAAK